MPDARPPSVTSETAQPFRTAAGGRIDRAKPHSLHASTDETYTASPATRWPRRCSPGRASRRPLLQVSPPARHHGGRRGRAERAGDVSRDAGVRTPAGHAQSPRDAGRAVRGPRGHQPEPLALPAFRYRRASTSVLSPLFPAGFYYKTFMWPRSAWKRCMSR